jgi:hypothetical protein
LLPVGALEHPWLFVMEAIAAAASLLALINVVSAAAKASINLCQNIRDAPAELTAFASHLLMIKAELELLRSYGDQLYLNVTSPDSIAALCVAFDSTQATLQALEQACSCIRRKSNGRLSRLRWAYVDKPAVQKLFEQLRNTELSLNTIQNLLALWVKQFNSILHKSDHV